jgi:hypothetical protein
MSDNFMIDDSNDFDEDSQRFLNILSKNNSILTFNEVERGVKGIDPFANIRATKSFEEMSAFNNSPFGKNWDKDFILADWERDKYNDAPPQSQWIYHLEKNADGKKLIDLYLHDNIIANGYGSDSDNLTDISIYYETDDSYNTFGSICFVKMNSSLASYLRKYSDSRDWLVKEIVDKEENKIDAKRLREAIDYELDTGGGMNFIAKIGAKLLLKLGESIREMRYPENVWNPALKNYDPVLPIGGIVKALKKWNSFKKDSDKFFKETKETGEWIAEHVPVIGEFLQGCIVLIADIFANIINAIDEIIQAIDKVVRILKLANAFICGVINECIEMAAGIMDLLALLLTMTDKVERQKIKEALENILESYRKQPSKIIDQLKEGFEKLEARYSSDNTEYQIAYNLGEDVVTVVLWVELIGGIIKAIKSLPKAFKKLEAWTEKSIKKIKGIELSKIEEELKVLRFKLIDKTVINSKWKVFVSYSELSKGRILALQKLRQEFGLLYKNVATLKIRAVTKEGKMINKEYIAHAGKGKKIPESTGTPLSKSSREFTDYLANGKKQMRWLDSENKMLIQMDKDLEPFNIIQMTMEWESTFTPCTICRREIILRKWKYNAKVFVNSPKFKNTKGKMRHVKTSKDFEKLIEQTK